MRDTIRRYEVPFLKTLVRTLTVALLILGASVLAVAAETTTEFSGHSVNSGTVAHEVQGGRHILALSKDFPIPGTPDPHWQVVDSKGTVYLLDRLKIKDDQVKRSIVVPPYVPDIAKVQIWCSFVEVVLGEGSFPKPVKAGSARWLLTADSRLGRRRPRCP